MQKVGVNTSLYFVGGTALRFLHRIRRYSEDLDLLYEAGLTLQESQKLPIAIEVDTNPPPGWKEEKTIVDVHLPVLLQHYDLPSLFAAKLAAVLTRAYTKGRDIYDLFWYRTKRKELFPNFTFLNNALSQKRKNQIWLHEQNWLEILC